MIITGFPVYFVFFISIFVFSLYIYFFVIQFKIQFLKKRKTLLNQFIELADLKGDENVLDIGTGSGFLAIGLTKNLKNGIIIGLDKYSIKSDNLKTQLATTIKTNFIGNTLKNAKKNARIENVEKKCKFIESDITNPLKFKDEYFDIIVSSQLLYCIGKNKRPAVFHEIDRVLKKNGKIIFFESKSFLNWNIFEAKNFFENKGYKIKLIQSNEFKTCCILFGKK
ncbi:MAG: methyltransferase domain-containing protein [Candidatus Dadabacteria bacterium]|nr:methyltransferase domain-containing protein [Candidatus Dadabacteria bacterium]